MNKSKKQRIMEYMATGRTLTAPQARARFGIQNFRATVSDIKEQVERYGNWEVYREPSKTSTSRYGMDFLGEGSNKFAIDAGVV
jgi:3-phenylpropionate/cinnamic acid dioxygenase small subunit